MPHQASGGGRAVYRRNHPAAQAHVPVIQHRALAGRYGPLRFGEGEGKALRRSFQCAGGILLAVAGLGGIVAGCGRVACAPASGRTSPALKSTAPKFAPTRCKCSVAAKAWAAKVAASKVAMTTAATATRAVAATSSRPPAAQPLRNAPQPRCSAPRPPPWPRHPAPPRVLMTWMTTFRFKSQRFGELKKACQLRVGRLFLLGTQCLI